MSNKKQAMYASQSVNCVEISQSKMYIYRLSHLKGEKKP
jgi:hypothetical protein